MGLLDDAIREHLELKRLRGADPGEVAREEKDALGPVSRESPNHLVGSWDSSAEAPVELSGSFFSESESLAAEVSSTANYLGQETVEINMDAELAAEVDIEQKREQGKRESTEGSRPEYSRQSAYTHADPDESLEWEAPGNADAEEDAQADESVEDVLEETPDFLRETPEQERLWFEQRPPRDFDFNE